MQTQSEHKTTPLPDVSGYMADMLQGVNSLTKGFTEYSNSCEMEKRRLRDQLSALSEPLPNIVASDKQNVWIAVLFVLYEMGLINKECSKKDYMKRMADALGSPGIADYSRQIYKFKDTAFKYDDIFKEIANVAQKIRDREEREK